MNLTGKGEEEGRDCKSMREKEGPWYKRWINQWKMTHLYFPYFVATFWHELQQVHFPFLLTRCLSLYHVRNGGGWRRQKPEIGGFWPRFPSPSFLEYAWNSPKMVHYGGQTFPPKNKKNKKNQYGFQKYFLRFIYAKTLGNHIFCHSSPFHPQIVWDTPYLPCNFRT